MKKISQSSHWPEIVFGSSESKKSQAIRRAITAGELKKIAPKLYTSNFKDPVELVIKRNLYHILGEFFPGAVISYRSALEGGYSKEGVLVLTYKYTKNWRLDTLTIKLIKGQGALPDDNPFIKNLFLASRERALLENLQTSRDKGSQSKVLPREYIEQYLDKLCRTYGDAELNQVRDKAKRIAKDLNLEKEYHILDKIIGALLGTKTAEVLQTKTALARAQGLAYDVSRLELFAKLAATLKEMIIKPIIRQPITDNNLRNLAFFEAYFSNYIEGTEFEIEEAADIIFRGKLTPYRPEDAHDILGTFQIVSNLNEMRHVPQTAAELFDLLKSRHALLMSARKEKEPGAFKNKINRAGSTVFVTPELVIGTLTKAFELYSMIEPGFKRAIFMMFLIAEVHPFLDGNGRIARIMMNAELEYTEECRIIIPTVYREDYILALRRLSREWDPNPYTRMLQRAQAFTASIDFSDYENCLEQFRKANAFSDPSEGKLKF